jgi:hypothetical protein
LQRAAHQVDPNSMGSARLGLSKYNFGQLRGKPGLAEVHMPQRRGLRHVLPFNGGTVTPDAEVRVKVIKIGDLWSVGVNNDERHRIPEGVTAGS